MGKSYTEIQKTLEQQEQYNHKLKMASLGEMLENITHQWKQPLNNLSIISSTNKFYIENSIEQSKKEQLKTYNDILKNVDFMNKTIDVFKNYFDKNKDKEKFHIKETIEDTLTICYGTLLSNNIQINFSYEENLIIYGIRNELMQVIINLLHNAKDALIEKNHTIKTIKIEIYKSDNKLRLIIKDNAGGIPENILNNIFDLYFTTKKENGSGIGLYLSKKIIDENFNGEIKAYNEKEGAVFDILIPHYCA